LDFENKHMQQQIELTQSLERAYSLTNGLKEELDDTLQKMVVKELRSMIEFKEQVESQLASFSRETRTRSIEL